MSHQENCWFCKQIRFCMRVVFTLYAVMFFVGSVENFFRHDFLRGFAAFFLAVDCALIAWYAMWILDLPERALDYIAKKLFS